jgi:acetate kinase
MPHEVIGVLNSGSASIKFALFRVEGEKLNLALRGQIEGIHTAPHLIAKSKGETKLEEFWDEGVKLTHTEATEHLLKVLRKELLGSRLVAIGHRVVHGGLVYKCPVRVDAQVLNALESLIPLAPLHQPYNLAPIRIGFERLPNIPQVACFDTGFHRTNPELAQMFALPLELHESGVRRYGFHGLSYEYVATALSSLDSQAIAGKCVVLHLGNGASMCALSAGQSVATTMGFTAVDGLPMGTRCGTIDPGAIPYLMEQYGMDARAIERLIWKRSGLLGVSGISNDMRTLLVSRETRAKLAIDLFVYRTCRELGSLAATLKGLDAIVFTGGIGENSAVIRQRICQDSAWLGIELDMAANKKNGPLITTAGSHVAGWVIATNEELMIARHTKRTLAQ